MRPSKWALLHFRPFGAFLVMRRAIPTACAAPGCPAITRSRFCPYHQRIDSSRRRAAQGDYGPNWERIRRAFLAAHPICDCGQRTTEVDHRVPRSQGGRTEWSNLVARCKSCHSRKTATQDMKREPDGRWGQGSRNRYNSGPAKAARSFAQTAAGFSRGGQHSSAL